jgi:hypothetical protein
MERSHSSLLIWRVVTIHIIGGGVTLYIKFGEESLFTFGEK